MLSIDFKQAQKLSFTQPISEYIRRAYNEDPSKYSADLAALESLRSDAIEATTTPASVDRVLRYLYAFTNLVEGKFPLDESSVKLKFTWQNSMNKDKKWVVSTSGAFERAALVFNLGALCFHLGQQERGQDGDAPKRSSMFYQQAAGCFSHILESILPLLKQPTSFDFNPDLLRGLSNMCLALSQECFFQKAVAENKMKPGLIARISFKTAEYYDLAFDNLGSVKEKHLQPMLFILQAKALYMNAQSHYYKSVECETSPDSMRFGEQVARLRVAVDFLRQATEIQKSLPLQATQELTVWKTQFTSKLQQAEKDNDVIYHQTIPRSTELAMIEKADLVKALKFMETYSPSSDVSALFASLVPMPVHNAVEFFKVQREIKVKERISKVDSLNEIDKKTLNDLQLPGSLEALEAASAIPEFVFKRNAEVRSSGGLTFLAEELSKLARTNNSYGVLLEQSRKILQEEENEDARLRQQYGSLWNRTPSTVLNGGLRDTIAKHQATLNAAQHSDGIVRMKLETTSSAIEYLCRDRGELERLIPSGPRSVDPTLAGYIQKIRDVLRELEALRKQRTELTSKFNNGAQNETFLKRASEMFARREPIDKETLSTSFIEESFNVSDQELATNAAEQEASFKKLSTLHRDFTQLKTRLGQDNKREEIFQKLEVGYSSFLEISSNIREGNKFYADFGTILDRFKKTCEDYKFARQTEVQDLTAELSRLNVSSNVGSYPNLSPGSSHPPQGTWSQGVSLNFGGPPSYDYAGSSTQSSHLPPYHSKPPSLPPR